MITLLLIAALIYTVYNVVVSVKFGLPWSVSQTFYLLKKRGWIFQLMCVIVGMSVAVVMFNELPEPYKFTGLCGFAMCFVGVAPCFKLELEGKVHYISAGICVGLSQLAVLFMCPWLLVTWFGYLVGIIVIMAKNDIHSTIREDFVSTRPMLWAEHLAVFNTVLMLLIWIL